MDLLYCESNEERAGVTKVILSHYPDAKIESAPKPLGMCPHRISVDMKKETKLDCRKYKILMASRGYGSISFVISLMIEMAGQSKEKCKDAKRFVDEMKLNLF